MSAAFLASFFAFGFFLDFICNGVLKIGTAVIWGTAYFAVACIIGTLLLESRWERWTRFGVIAFVVGSLGGHFFMADRHSERTYLMTAAPQTQIQDAPITLGSEKWPQILLVISDKLKTELSHRQASEPIPVKILVSSSYGCIQGFIVDQVAGIDVRVDPSANWVWKTDPHSTSPALSGPGLEDQSIPWCPAKAH